MTSLHGITYKGRACFPGQGTFWCLVRVGREVVQVPAHTKGAAFRKARQYRKMMRKDAAKARARARAGYWRARVFVWLEIMRTDVGKRNRVAAETASVGAFNAGMAAREFGFRLP